MVEANVKIIEELKIFLGIVVKDPEIRALFTGKPGDFSRDRKMPMEKLIALLVNLPKRSLSVEIQGFFDAIGRSELSCTKGAFCLQRVKLKPMFFQIWNQCLVDNFYHYYGASVKRWQGFRLFAVDGSTFYLINKREIAEYFGTQDNQHVQVPMCRVMQIDDVLNNITFWGDLYPINKSEQAVMAEQVSRLPTDSLTLFDRAYPSYSLIYLMNNQETPRHFVMRCKVGFNEEVKSFVKSRKCTKIVTLYPTNSAIEQLKTYGYIVTKETGVKVRMLKIKLPTGEIEVLLTSLYSEKIYTLGMLKDLYAMRWAIETTYGIEKNQLQMEIFSGHKVVCIKQDYAAGLFVANLQSLINKQCEVYVQQLSENRKYEYRINRNVSWAALKDKVIKLFLYNNSVAILLDLQKSFERNTEPVRPNRQYQRVRKSKRIRGKYQTLTNYRRAI